jgi:hypothetical protein
MSSGTPPAANFPTSVWDTLTTARNDAGDYIEPGPEEYLRLVSEIVALETHLYPVAADAVIWVAPHGIAATATGSIVNPFPTLALAFAAVSATKTIVALMPGTYTLAAIQAIPVTQDGLKIVGVGGSSATIIAGADANQALSLTPGAQGAAFTVTLEGVTINQFAAKKGLYVDDTAIDGAVTINLKDVHMVMDTSGSSIDLLHAVNQTVTINAEDCTFTGEITLDCFNASDAFNFTRCATPGGIVSDAGAVTAAFVFEFCKLKSAGMSGGHANQTIVALYCTADDGTLAETGEFAGSHTETLVSPVSA